MTASDPFHRFDTRRLLEFIAVFTVSISITGLVAMRLGLFHAPQIWIIGLLLTFGYGRLTSATGYSSSDNPAPFWHLVLVIAVALLFRLTPYVYLLGGQDEGVYVNMAHELLRTGSLTPVDTVLSGISDPALRDLYRHTNYQPTTYLPGVYATGGGLQFQFYHLFPIWLAMFGSLFGVAGTGYGLTFLSLVSILFFQRLAHLISGQAKVGLVAGLLLAVNPLHAFFSKFPVTEVPTLAFSTASFAFLLTYWQSPQAHAANRFVALSLAALAMLFMTRISGFMYLPLFVGFLFVGLLIDRQHAARRGLMFWAVAAIWLYFLSVLYGLKWSTIYATDIYRMSFAPLLGEGWKVKLLLLGAAISLGWLIIWGASQKPNVLAFIRRGVAVGARLLPLLMVAIALVAAWKAYRLGYSDEYAAHPWIGKYFHLSHRGLYSVASVSLVASAVYLSPFMLLAFFAVSFRRALNPVLQLLLFFVVWVFASMALVLWVLYYQPYYARYLLSEFVPYLMLFVVCSWTAIEHRKLRALIGAALVFSGLYCAALSALQLGKNEHDGVAQSLAHIVSRFDQRDLVVVDQSLNMPIAHEIKTALVYTYGLPVVTMTDEDIGNERYLRGLAKPYDDLYLITRGTTPPPGFAEVDSVHFVERAFRHGVTPPIALWPRADSRLVIYKRMLRDVPMTGEAAIDLSAGDPEIATAVGIKTVAGLEATGKPGYLMFGPYQPLAPGNYSLVVMGSASRPFTLDVVARRGAVNLGAKEFAAAEDAGTHVLARLDFVVASPVKDLEVRINVPAESDVRIKGYKVLRQ